MSSRRRVVIAATALAVVAAGTAGLAGRHGTSTAAAASTCSPAPAVFPESSLKAGMTGTGYTVIQGTKPVAFGVKVLGVLPDGIAPGVDFVAIQVSGWAVQKTGIAAGFSGSPVYIDGKLAGAVSYGFYASDPTIGGMTPAQPMVDLFGYPTGTFGAATPKPATSVKLSPALRSTVAHAAGVPTTAAGTGTARELPVPLAESGLNDREMNHVQGFLDRGSLPFLAYRAGTASAPSSVDPAPLVPGDSVSATISYGDVTFAGIGTLTATCGNESVSFGHPMLFNGSTLLGMNGANVVTVVPSILEPFKLANVTGFHGIIDQDRLTGIRGIEGTLPALTAITETVTNTDLGRSRTGETDVASPDFLALVANAHVISDEDVVFDRIGDGSANLTWTINGTRANGSPFTLNRSDLYYSPYDISFDSGNEITGEIGQIQNNRFEKVRITSVHVTSSITQQHLTAQIVKVETSSRLQPTLAVHPLLHVLPGESVKLAVWLRHADGSETISYTRANVPENDRFGGILFVRGGIPLGGCQYCGIFGGQSTPNVSSFDALLAAYANSERYSDLVAAVSGTGGAPSKTILPRSGVITGHAFIRLVVG